MVTTLDPEVPGSSPEWVPIFYEARSTAQGLPEPSSLRGSTSVPEQKSIKAVTGACKLIDGCSLERCSATPSVASSGICLRNKVNSIACLYRDGIANSINYITLHTYIFIYRIDNIYARNIAQFTVTGLHVTFHLVAPGTYDVCCTVAGTNSLPPNWHFSPAFW